MDALAVIVHKGKVQQVGKRICIKLREKIRRCRIYMYRIEPFIGSDFWLPNHLKSLPEKLCITVPAQREKLILANMFSGPHCQNTHYLNAVGERREPIHSLLL